MREPSELAYRLAALLRERSHNFLVPELARQIELVLAEYGIESKLTQEQICEELDKV